MHLKRLELNGFKSFAHKSEFVFDVPIIAIVGPNGSGKSNVVEAIRFVLGEQSVKSMRGKTGSDLIFKGSQEISALSRASVSIIFDNTDRVFHLEQGGNTRINVDFDEITITREVYSDGANTYRINGSEVRMKDVHELIASINIGASGHHIISQGEADRYLNANLKDRRVLIEEALGLKVYQYRIKESLRKLERAQDNMRESELVRRELGPHLRFLKKQVEKIEKSKHLQRELHSHYLKYFAQEDYFIAEQGKRLDAEREQVQELYLHIQTFLDQHRDVEEPHQFKEEESIRQEQALRDDLARELLVLRQELGRIDGMIGLLKNQSQEQQQISQEKGAPQGFSYATVKGFLDELSLVLKNLSNGPKEEWESRIFTLQKRINNFLELPVENLEKSNPVQKDHTEQINALAQQYKEIEESIHRIESDRQQSEEIVAQLQNALQESQKSKREEERTYYEYLAKKKELDGRRAIITERDETLGERMKHRSEEYTEAMVLLGLKNLEYQSIGIEHQSDITAGSQEQFRREVERMKIRLEDMGGGSGIDIINEYNETLERDTFLEKEITDITTSIESLQLIIAGLTETLNHRFDIGISKINTQFDKFFKSMFGGGKAELESAIIKKRKKRLSDEEQLSLDISSKEDESEDEFGIDIKVQLPRKKVSDLDMLSGGERSLTSIALLFALSQVNPPPFLVLDETDAALDEANSQKYGDMIESLSEYSQLIVVTHNRETMSRAQTLFGVTLGRGDASTTLSLRLEDASKYAK